MNKEETISEEEKVVLNQEAIQICPVCGERSVVVRYGIGNQATKIFCLECGRFWIESEGIKNEDPREYIDWKIRELDKKVQEMVEDVKSKLVNNKEFCLAFVGAEEDTYGKEIDEKNKQLDKEVEWIVEGAISKVITAYLTAGVPCDPDIADAIIYIESCLEKMRMEEKI